jgi:cell wall-associated NlpC family hydrolase
MTRREVVYEARTWLSTPYHLRACVKGAGCDCFTWIAATMVKAGLMTLEELPAYQQDWWCHITEEQYLVRLARFATKVFEGVGVRTVTLQPGCVVATRAANSRVFNHGAIVTSWPFAIHAIDPEVAEINALFHPMWANNVIEAFDPWEGKA